MWGALKSLFGQQEGRRNRRNEERREIKDGHVRIYNDTYPLKDWSASGFLASPCSANHKSGDEVAIFLSVPLRGRRMEFDCRALVVRVNQDMQHLAAMFVMMDNSSRAMIDEEFGVFAAS
jgi:hypothetical protein